MKKWKEERKKQKKETETRFLGNIRQKDFFAFSVHLQHS